MTFYTFLAEFNQLGHSSAIGDFAKDAVKDQRFPKTYEPYEVYKEHLEHQGASDDTLSSFEKSYYAYLALKAFEKTIKEIEYS